MSIVVTTYLHLESRPKSAYQQLFIKGTRIRAEVIYAAFVNAEDPLPPEQIAADYGLPTGAVEEAIAYCQSNPPELESDHEAEEALIAATGMLHPHYKEHATPKLLSAQEMARLQRS